LSYDLPDHQSTRYVRPDFNKLANELESYISNELPTKAEELVMESIDDNFDTESYTEEDWQPLSARYKKRKGEGKRILSDTGDMRSGISSDVGDGEITISADTEYAGYHNDGGTTEGRPPRRQFIPTEEHPDTELEQDLYDMIELDINDIIK